MRIKKRLSEEAIKRQNAVINATVNIMAQYLDRGLTSKEVNAIVEFVETKDKEREVTLRSK